MSLSPVKLYQKCYDEMNKRIENVHTEFLENLNATKANLRIAPETLHDPQAYFKRSQEIGEWSLSRLNLFYKLRRELDEAKPLIDKIPQPNNEKDWVAPSEGTSSSWKRRLKKCKLEKLSYCGLPSKQLHVFSILKRVKIYNHAKAITLFLKND